MMYHGRGVWLDGSTGEIYEGYFAHNKRFGHGRVITAEGEVYLGEVDGMNAHGKGTRFFPDGGFKTGDWIENKMNGSGKFSFEAGVYTG